MEYKSLCYFFPPKLYKYEKEIEILLKDKL